ncbi:MAG: VOC family protein [Nannocystaceae bacterium]|nr:VOC family protein [Nannocystaceae bacterium]
MINALSHASIYVEDQDAALEFYTKKLEFEVRMDAKMAGFRWLTVGPKDQKDVEIVLMSITGGPLRDEETIAQMKALLAKGALGAGVFRTADCKATYETLKARGVEFTSEPKEQPYGVEAVFKDNSGNWFSLTQPRSA